MKISNKRSYTTIFLVLFISLPILFVSLYEINFINSNDSNNNITSVNESKIKTQGVSKEGKNFTTVKKSNTNCYINREQPSLNMQPNIYIPDNILSHASMDFKNIEAINYTRNIEDQPSEFLMSSINGPIYVYQKFSIEISQFVNNVSIFIQDINDPEVFTDESYWEVAFVNCSNDSQGTPNPNTNETIAALKKPHPIIIAAHWEFFDFKNSSVGAIFLNTSNTNKTIENGIEKYWFALRIRIPPDETLHHSQPKFLYFNPDEGSSNNIGEGDTFAISPEFYDVNYTTNYVVENRTENGIVINGNTTSFTENDTYRFFVKNDSNLIQLYLRVEIENLTYNNISYEDLLDEIIDKGYDEWWSENHFNYIYSIDISLALNISNFDAIQNCSLYLVKSDSPQPQVNLSRYINITKTEEELIVYKFIDPFTKYFLLSYMNHSANANNSLVFLFEYYNNPGMDFNVTIDQFTVEMGELYTIDTIQCYDPLIQEMYYTKSVNLTCHNNKTYFDNQSLELLKYNENDFYRAQADTNNITMEFKFHILPDLDISSWNSDDLFDWIIGAPNPIIPQIDVRISSNVSIQDRNNLTHAILEIYQGDKSIEYLPEGEWVPFLSGNKSYAYENETTKVTELDAFYTWIVLQLMNESDNNAIKFRLRYIGNDSFTRFNVTIDEFTLNFHIQNAIPSDYASKISVGLNSETLKPSDIILKNLGDLVADDGNWDGNIADGTPYQGYFEFNVTSLWHAIRFDIDGTYKLYKIKVVLNFSDTLDSQYKTGDNLFSVNITNWDGDPFENMEVTYEILDINKKVVSKTTAISNEDGVASASLRFEETGNNFSIRISFSEKDIYTSSSIISTNFSVVDDFILFMNTFLLILPYILMFIAGILVFMVLRQQKLSKYRKYWAGEALILDDLLKISYIMIIHKDAGVTIFNNQISMDLDSDLIGGFLTAISSFRTEIKKSGDDAIESGGKGFEMDYYDFKIVITDGSLVRVALILEGAPSENLKKNQWAFSNAFETKFKAILQKFTGNIEPFRETDKMVEKYFNITLTYPLQLGKHWEVIDLSPLEKALIEVAEQVQKEKKFFFVSSLLSFGLAGRKESRDQIISTILSLKRKGLIIPIEMK